MIKAVIFDLDGTITEPFFDFDAIRRQMGLDENAGPVLEAMEKMSPDRRKAAEAILESHEKAALEQSKLNAGVEQTFAALRNSGIKVGILSRNRRANALAIASRHKLSFDEVICREDGPVKPDAFGVLELCRRFAVKPDQSLVVGDYLFDLLSARAAGAWAVLLANHSQADEFAAYADFTIDRIDQLMHIIEKKNNSVSADGCMPPGGLGKES